MIIKEPFKGNLGLREYSHTFSMSPYVFLKSGYSSPVFFMGVRGVIQDPC